MGMTGWHEFAEFVAEDVGTVDSGQSNIDRYRCIGSVQSSHFVDVCVRISDVFVSSHTTNHPIYLLYIIQHIGLNSMVLASNTEAVLLPVNEPTYGTKRKSQIQTYLEQNGGAGKEASWLLPCVCHLCVPQAHTYTQTPERSRTHIYTLYHIHIYMYVHIQACSTSRSRRTTSLRPWRSSKAGRTWAGGCCWFVIIDRLYQLQPFRQAACDFRYNHYVSCIALIHT
jgi:hypothetical protein